MKIALSLAAVPALAIAALSTAQAATVIDTGTYGSGAFSSVSGAVNLGPGQYRFTIDFATAPTYFLGWTQKQTITDFICGQPGGGTIGCGGNDVPTLYDFSAVTPLHYETPVFVVNPARSVPFVSGPFIRYDESETCCSYFFDFEGGAAGNFALSVTSVPEPGSWVMMIIGLGAVGAVLRRREPVKAVPA